MTGQFFESFSQGLARDSAGSPTYPEVLACQFPSWELARDWERATTLELYPGGPNFEPLARPVISESDEDLQRFRDTNPEKYLVEFEAQWAEVDCPYLRRGKVLAMFEPIGDQPLTMQEARGSLRHDYVAHVDLSLVDDNTALVIAHAEPGDDQGRPHIVVDLIRVWLPADFPDGHIHLGSVEAELKRYLTASSSDGSLSTNGTARAWSRTFGSTPARSACERTSK